MMKIKESYTDHELMRIAMNANRLRDDALKDFIDAHKIVQAGFMVPAQSISRGDIRVVLQAIREHENLENMAGKRFE